ncbi:short-chain dehydrogenase/reductase family protein [Cavenderia fasciculata]|uniref:Short-chain dehydrogenase/reductase family protein n=1 Tax=Cavenderia fasciculata TaxID=261658 RepID=F4PHE5_CACFS|nr:short-chain dehydrogenase/reductase family protein [Cavenderia fasciculata]EGG25129.1 short-chain dehydrogenase/reductase family protein [Cavenderia fasciculata]|eukprot:XP_004362980.1 short-chain dehydrogenase/reductase family protein [Cavenderia fasciculata]
MEPIKEQVWYITGATGGLGLALAEKVLSAGHKVAGTTRDLQKFEKTGLATKYGDKFLAVQTDLIDEEILKASFVKVVQVFGRIDIVVNNSGYAQPGAIEEISTKEYKENFDINFFAPLSVMRYAIPYLKEKSGHIYNIASIAGFTHFEGCSAYSSSKYALIGASESLAYELKPYNVKVTAVCPGTFETPILAGFPKPAHVIPEYDSANFIHVWLARRKGLPLGDPEKYAEILLHYANRDDAPVKLFVGPDAVDIAQQEIDKTQAELNSYKEFVSNTAIAPK